jgi:adenylosuccinate lyase
MIDRYTFPEMEKVWNPDSRFQKWLDVEIAVLEAQAEKEFLPKDVVEKIRKKAKIEPRRIDEIERKVKHDVIAFLTNLKENVGEEARYIHLGLTSSDILDTALALQLQEAGRIIQEELDELLESLKEKAVEHRETVMTGRTHGVHAEPITLGLKFLSWFEEIRRSSERFKRALDNVSYGKISGSVGNYAHVDPDIEDIACEHLGLKPERISTQVIQRDRHGEFLLTLAIIASSLERFATEIRSLQRTEIRELEEPFHKGQKGSSSMPHKRNPEICERICGLARVIRANGLAALENIALWGERDISHSSVERIIFPDSTILIHYILRKFREVVQDLSVFPNRMLENLHKTKGLIFSQAVLSELVRKGLTRDQAYDVVQKNAMKCWEGMNKDNEKLKMKNVKFQNNNQDFKSLLLKDRVAMKYLSPEELDDCFDMKKYLRNVDKIYKRVL